MPVLRNDMLEILRSSMVSPLDGSNGSSIVPTVGGLVANRTQYNTDLAAITAPFTSRREHFSHPDGPTTAIQCYDINRLITAVAVTTTGGVHSIKRFIEYPLGQVATQFLWAGANTVSKTAGARQKSDVMSVNIPAATKFWEHTVILTTGSLPVIVAPAGSDVLGVDDGNAAGDIAVGGSVPPTTGLNTFGCQALLGTVQAPNAKSYVLLGDSLTFGALDDSGVGSKHSSGWVGRVLDIKGYPYMKWCFGGQQVADQVTLAATINADLAQFGFTDLILQSGINDLRLGRTTAQIQADIQTLFAQTNITGKRKWPCTLGPRSTSTDAWATVVNQTAQTDGNMADLNPHNAAVRAGLANAFGFIELADAAMDVRDSGKHKAPPAGTVDGTHYNSVRAALIAGLLTGAAGS